MEELRKIINEEVRSIFDFDNQYEGYSIEELIHENQQLRRAFLNYMDRWEKLYNKQAKINGIIAKLDLSCEQKIHQITLETYV